MVTIGWLQQTLQDAGLAGLIAGIITTVMALFALDGPRWDALVVRRQVEHDALAKHIERYYRHRPTGRRLYRFAPLLALRTTPRKRQIRLNERACIAWGMSAEQRAAGFALAREWLATVGALAVAVRREGRPLRRFLQTYHLSVIREALLVLPFVAGLWADDSLNREEKNQAVSGLALMNLAASYNSLARQQREPVYFKGTADTPPLGPIVRSPGMGKRIVCSVSDRILRSLRLSDKRWRRAQRLLENMARSLPPSSSGSRAQ